MPQRRILLLPAPCIERTSVNAIAACSRQVPRDLRRPGTAGPNTTARTALQQIPSHLHKLVLIHTDSGGGTHGFVDWATRRRLKYSVGFYLTDDVCVVILTLPEHVWQCAYDADRRPRPSRARGWPS